MYDRLEMGVDCVPPENDAKGQDKGVVLGEMGKVSEARRRGRSARTAAGVAGDGWCDIDHDWRRRAVSVRIVRLPMRGRLRVVWRCQASRHAATHLCEWVCIVVGSCESRVAYAARGLQLRIGDAGGSWRLRGLGGACPVCFVAICAVLRVRVRRRTRDERERSKQESDLEEHHGRYRMGGMDMARKSPALFPALCPAPVTKTGNRAGSIVPYRCLSCPLSFRLSSVKSSCSTGTYLSGCAAHALCARRPFAIAMSTRSENNPLRELSLTGLGGRQRYIRKSHSPAWSWSRGGVCFHSTPSLSSRSAVARPGSSCDLPLNLSVFSSCPSPSRSSLLSNTYFYLCY